MGDALRARRPGLAGLLLLGLLGLPLLGLDLNLLPRAHGQAQAPPQVEPARPTVAADPGTEDIFWTQLWHGFVGSLVFGLLGIVLTVLGFKIFDWINPKIDIQQELAERNNLAVAIVTAAIVLGIAMIAAVAVK